MFHYNVEFCIKRIGGKMEKNLWMMIQEMNKKKVMTQADWEHARGLLSLEAFLSLREHFNNKELSNEKGDQWL